MPLIIPNTPTQDTYVAALTFAGHDVFVSGQFTVANNAVFAQLSHGIRGSARMGGEVLLPPGTYTVRGNARDPVAGVRFRSAVAGSPAQVFGALFYLVDTSLEGSGYSGPISSAGGAGSILAIDQNSPQSTFGTGIMRIIAVGAGVVIAASSTTTETLASPFSEGWMGMAQLSLALNRGALDIMLARGSVVSYPLGNWKNVTCCLNEQVNLLGPLPSNDDLILRYVNRMNYSVTVDGLTLTQIAGTLGSPTSYATIQ